MGSVKENKKDIILTAVFGLFLFLFLFFVLYINFISNPAYYDGDMYADLNLAKEIWKTKSLLPAEWYFGNQLSVVSTPVLAALIYGICGKSIIAMAAASSLMTVFVFAAFDFMLRPYTKMYARIGGFLIMAAYSAAVLHLAKGIQGWQLFFTMCSYYAAYLICAMLSFGCYARIKSGGNLSKSFWIAAVIACVLSFGTGMQSIRQTEVMVIPMVLFEAVSIICKKSTRRSAAFTAAVAACNIAGLILIRFLPFKQHKIFGETRILPPSKIISELPVFLKNIGKYIICKDYSAGAQAGMFILLTVVSAGLILLIRKSVKEKKLVSFSTLLILMGIGVAGVAALDLFTAMNVRNIYYFMIYPIAGVSAAYLLSSLKGKSLAVTASAVCICFAATAGLRFCGIIKENRAENRADIYSQVSSFLEDEGYRTIYSDWNIGARIAVASDDRVQAGLWRFDINTASSSDQTNVQNELFLPVEYLSIPHIFEKESTQDTAYVIGKDAFTAVPAAAEKFGASVNKIAEFSDKKGQTFIVFTSDKPLCSLTYTAKYGKSIDF